MSTAVDHEIELVNLEDLDWDISCESDHCQDLGRGAHAAHWLVWLTCTCVHYWCDARMIQYRLESDLGMYCAVHHDTNWLRYDEAAYVYHAIRIREGS